MSRGSASRGKELRSPDRGDPGRDDAGSADGDGEGLRVLVVTSDDALYVSCFFQALIPALPDSVRGVGVTVLPAFQERLFMTATRVLRLYGPVDFARLCLRYASVRVRGRSISRLARTAGIPLIESRSVNSEDYLRRAAGGQTRRDGSAARRAGPASPGRCPVSRREVGDDCYRSFPQPEDVLAFRARGHCLL